MAIKKDHYISHPATCKKCGEEFIRKHRGRYKCDTCDAERHRKKNYGHCINFDEWETKFDTIHSCQMCNKPFGDNNLDKKVIDHLGEKIRGIICKECNTALGFLRENIRVAKAAVSYLERTTSREEA